MIGRYLPFASCLATIALLPAYDLQSVGQSSSAVVEGVVVTASSADPIVGAEVTISGGNFARTGIADSGGKFVFRKVPGGRYRLVASKQGYVGGRFGQRSAVDSDKTLAVNDGQSISTTLRLWKRGVITGRIADEAGEPAIAVAVDALGFEEYGLTAALVRSGTALTDDRGVYRISVSPGQYLIAVAGSDSQPLLRSENYKGRGFPLTFYPGGSSAAHATLLTPKSEETLNGVDLVVPDDSGVVVSGRVGPDGIHEPLQVWLEQDGALLLPAGLGRRIPILSSDGSFRFQDVAPGDYVLGATARTPPKEFLVAELGTRGLQFSGTIKPGQPFTLPPQGPMHWAQRRLSVRHEDINAVDLQLQPGLVISGKVLLQGRTGVPGPAELQATLLLLVPIDHPAAPSAIAKLEPDLTFRFEAIAAGRYVLKCLLAFKGWAPEAIAIQGADVTHSVVTVSGSVDDLLITLSDRLRPSLSGTVRNRRGEAVPFATVYLFPSDPDKWGFLQGGAYADATGTDQNGTFRFEQLLPATYLVVARDEYLIAWRRSDVLGELRKSALSVRLQAGDRQELSLISSR